MNPSPINNLANYPSPTWEWYSDVMLAMEVPNCQHGLFAEEEDLPMNEGGTVIFRRGNRMPTAAAKVPLGDMTPPPTPMSVVDIKATVKPYGAWHVFDFQVVQLSSQKNLLNQRAMTFGIQMQEVYDELLRDMLATSSSVYNCQSGGGADFPTPPGLADIKRVRRGLLRSSAQKITKEIGATEKINTAPIRAAWWGLGHVDLETDLENIPGWVPSINYSSSFQSLKNEAGSVIDFRFNLSPLGYQEANASNQGNTVYTIFMCADQSYGMVRMSNGLMFRAIESGTIADPMFMQNAAMWRAWWAPTLFNSAWLYRMRCTRTE